MKIAIYSRKSKVTEKGNSIDNQIKVCKDYINNNYKFSEINIYEDEGFSGGNIDRPMYKKLIEDINNDKIDILVCYRLDRVSRNVVDFSNTLELLQEKKVGFISIKESFDTTNPMGKAMVYISSVFAQLERETIAQRIKDNLEELAKHGRYIGSKPSLGYIKKRIYYIDRNNNSKSYNILELDIKYSEFIKDMYKKYLSLQSISKLQTYYLQHNIKTQSDKIYKCATIKRLLTHPIYACADINTYEYFTNLGCQVVDSVDTFNGKYGINIYRITKKNRQGSPSLNQPKNWIIGVGSHMPLISSKDWIKVQEIINKRKNLTIRRPIGKCGLLSSILICGNCGDYMRPVGISKDRFYYSCNTKIVSKKQLCNIKNIRGDLLDNEIIQSLMEMYSNNIHNKLVLEIDKIQYKKLNKNFIKNLEKDISKNKNTINNLISKLSTSNNFIFNNYIEDYIIKLHNDIKDLTLQIEKLNNGTLNTTTNELTINLFKSKFKKSNLDELNFIAKRNMLRTILKKVVYNYDNIEVEL